MRFLISGYYGFGNLGDEALLKVIVSQLRTRRPYDQIDVLSASAPATAHELSVDATPRWDAKAVRAAIARADVLVSGGGGLLQDATSLRSLVYYAGIIRAAANAGKKTMIFAQSIGPLDFWGKRVVKECCKNVTAATVRDSRSASLLRSIVSGVRVEQAADPVFLYDAAGQDDDLAAEGLGPQSDPLVIVSVRKAAGLKDRVDVIARAVDRLAAAHGARVAFLPLGGAADAEVSALVIRKCKSAPVLLPECSLERAANVIRTAKAVVGMRLHALILAARYGVPFVAIPYDPKVTALCDDLAYPLEPLFVLNPPSIKPTPQETDALIDRFWSQREALSAHLLGAGERLRALALRNFEVLDEVAEGKGAP